ncbi:hypothetical protein BEP19_13600 [Ammoniphilus oxalaticus]|uniref:Double zinc ribbon domain-containing protein n=1 Tax=Ammoniphilus oxalaticus TaxID=66863 RepID=A0A419SF70_9BACL|nr:ComF family protein [Ammoniphilus oxalaticus]RKD22099.1 hypothetical protein BEP19_13600 [Ammoniphilus oxalaticus]
MKNLLELLFPTPPSCVLCERKAVQRGFCKLCWESLELIDDQQRCERCGRAWSEKGTCSDCRRRSDTYFVCNRSAVQYNDKMKEMISLYKFRGLELLAASLALFLEQAYRTHYTELHFDAITFVPLHEKRLQERGFNQAEQLARILGKRVNIPVYSLLTRIRYTEKQSKKGRQARLEVLGESFAALPIPPSSPSIKRVLLVDDIYTTGSTLNQCAKILADQGLLVYTLTIAR